MHLLYFLLGIVFQDSFHHFKTGYYNSFLYNHLFAVLLVCSAPILGTPM